MSHTTDTICAISTPPGIGGIAVIRVSGPKAIEAVQSLWRGRDLTSVRHASAVVGEIIDNDGDILDQAVATIFRAPHSYTSHDTVEISVHGSVYVQSRLLRLLIDTRLCRMAEPGEYTRLAYLAGRLDLAQVEAVADILAARTAGAHSIAIHQLKGSLTGRIRELRERLIELASLLELELDFSEEDVEFASRSTLIQLTTDIISRIDRLTDSYTTGQAILNGYPLALAGATNAGKSTLLNLLLDDDRAIVSDVHGTTRDT
ncbi:MAG: tRNA uridine-5-carboxymethylaminomethyl(34) synthesis GTPase MnmE, partial [Bacteroidales bacterium]|nr:tRNA uridine-5-carboxymethylaminomethyl(34) synthesis GTPase MnmE [Bacteroidales bacterium]